MDLAEFSNRFAEQFETLPERLGGHIGLSLAALLVGILISIPLGIFVSTRPKAETFFMTLASMIQTIPGLALLALMVFAFGKIGWTPAWIALILYSLLPMLRNTVTGLQGVGPAYIEAARGIGMNDRQMLFQVKLPLALPSIVSGIRTASVWVVGAATLAQPVGAVSLGNYIFVGLQTLNWVSIFFGCLFSAILALSFDALLRGLEIAASRRKPGLAVAMGGLVCLLAGSPFILDAMTTRSAVGKSGLVFSKQDSSKLDSQFNQPIVIASKNFSESYILMRVIETRLQQQNLPVETKDGMGSALVFKALAQGEVDCYVDYTGTIWANYMKRTDSVSPVKMLVEVASFLNHEFDIISLGSLGFSNDYVFMMRPE
ncbi:MAG: ABC transporter permease/substrate-binding protein, partial [Planctomycetota bacterium]